MTELTHPPSGPRPELTLLPPVDVIEDAQGITLYADLPGVPRDRLQVRVAGNQLSLEGEAEAPLPEGPTAGTAGPDQPARPVYRRSFTLSSELDAEGLSAELSQGVLRLRIPRAAHAQPRRIQVAVA